MYPINPPRLSADINKKLASQYHNIQGTKNADEGRLQEALNNFTKAIRLSPENHIAYFNRGTIKADLGDFEGAKMDFAAASKISQRKV
jgi:Flp pilus assembly protein TadD